MLYFNEEEKEKVDDKRLKQQAEQMKQQQQKGKIAIPYTHKEEEEELDNIFKEYPPDSFRQSRADNRAHLSHLHID